MGHALITGTSGSGKSYFGKWLALQCKTAGHVVLVYDPDRDPDWTKAATWKTDDLEALRFQLEVPGEKVFFIDEAGDEFERNRANDWFAARSRKLGNAGHFITQRPMQMRPEIRTNCESGYIFRSEWDECETLARQFIDKRIMDAHKLDVGEFFQVSKFGKDRFKRGWFDVKAKVYRTKAA